MSDSVSFSKRRPLSTILILILIVTILLQLAGCRLTTSQPKLLKPDPNVLAIEELIRAMPDEVVDDMAKIFETGLGYLSESALMSSCLPGPNIGILEDGHNLGWTQVESIGQLREILLNEVMLDVYDVIDSAESNCSGSGAGGENPYVWYGRNSAREAQFLPSGVSVDSSKREEYIACMFTTDRWIQDRCSNPIADAPTSNDEPAAGTPDESHESPDNENEPVAGVPDISDESPDNEDQQGNSPGEPEPGTSSPAPSESPAEENEESAYWSWLWDNVTKKDTGVKVIAVIVPVGILVGCTVGTFGAGTPLCAAGALASAKVAATGASLYLGWEVFVPDPDEAPGYKKDDCFTPNDNYLPTDHPLQTAQYQLGGQSPGFQEMYDGCTCMTLGDDPDPRSWGCKDEAEKRRDCLRTPYGPDDAPRPECIELLFEDNGIDPPDQCSAALCPPPYTLVNQEQCTCGLPAPPDGLVPEPGVEDACVETQCGTDSVPMVVNGACGCVSIGGPGEGPGSPPGSPPGPPPPETP